MTRKAPAFNGRAARIIGWLTENPDGLQFGQLSALESTARPETTRTQLGATLYQLIDSDRVTRHGKPHHYLYRVATSVQTTAAGTALAQKPKRYTSTLARAPKPESQPPLARTKLQNAVASQSIRIGTSGTAADDIAADVAAFLRAGGSIQRLGRHDTSKPFERLFRDDQSPKPSRRKKAEPTTRADNGALEAAA